MNLRKLALPPLQVILPLHKAGMMKGSVSGRSDDKLYIQFSFNMLSGLACIQLWQCLHESNYLCWSVNLAIEKVSPTPTSTGTGGALCARAQSGYSPNPEATKKKKKHGVWDRLIGNRRSDSYYVVNVGGVDIASGLSGVRSVCYLLQKK